MTTEEINKRFSELAGIHYHTFPKAKKYKDIFGNICLTNRGRKCSCGVHYNSRYKKPNLDYCAHPDLVLEEMKDRKDYFDFINTVGRAVPVFTTVECFIAVDLIMDKTGLLALLAIRWMEEKKC